MNKPRLPKDLRSMSQIALLGVVPPHVRLIIASITDRACLVRMVVDRPVDEDDHDMMEAVLTEIDAGLGRSVYETLDLEIVESVAPLDEIEQLHGALYKRFGEPSSCRIDSEGHQLN